MVCSVVLTYPSACFIRIFLFFQPHHLHLRENNVGQVTVLNSSLVIYTTKVEEGQLNSK